jgi:hypothetical protein
MAFEHYWIVLNSNLYDGNAACKFVLSRIAHFVQEHEDKDGNPIRKEPPFGLPGYAVVSARELGFQCGMSERQVQRHIRRLIKDCLLISEVNDFLPHGPKKYHLDLPVIMDAKRVKPGRKRRGKPDNGPLGEGGMPVDELDYVLDGLDEQPTTQKFEVDDLEYIENS